MIKERTTITDNYWIEGLDISSPSSLSLEVSKGKFCVENSEETIEAVDYEAFSFDIEPDTLVDVIYDVYLLKTPSIDGLLVHIDRTELSGDNIPYYEGEEEVQFTLTSFLVPANTTDLSSVEIVVNKAVKHSED